MSAAKKQPFCPGGDELRYADNIELQYIKYRCYLVCLG